MLQDQIRFPYRARTHAVGVGILLLTLGTHAAFGQSYTWDKIDPAFEKLTTVSAQKSVKTQIVMGTRLSSNRAAFEDWYRKYLFPAMASQEHLGDMYGNRDSLIKDLERCVDPSTHQVLLDLAFEEASKRVTGNYHPAARFNAMLIIGSLNQSEVRRAERLPPIRLAKALDLMLAEFKKPDQLDVLQIAAMVGMERHLHLVGQRPQDQPIPDGTKAEIAALMTALVVEKTPPAGREEKIHTWLRRRAVDVLATMGQVGDSQSVFDALVTVTSDSKEPISLRCTAARALGDLSYTDVTGVDPVATAQKLGALVATACRLEDTWVKGKQKELEEAKRKGRSGLPGMGGGMGGGYGEGGYGSEGGYGEGGYGSEGGYGEGGYGSEGGYGEGGYGSEGGYGEGGYGGTQTPKEPDEVTNLMNNRRRIKLPIYFAQLGIRGEPAKSYTSGSATTTLGSVAQLADDSQKVEIQKILDALNELLDATDLVEDGLDEMMTQIRTKTRSLESILPESVIAEPDEEDADNSLPGANLPGADLPGADLPGGDAAEPGKS